MKLHRLKIQPEYFQAIIDGIKPWEVRKDDRGFKLGDILLLQEWDPSSSTYSGRSVRAKITYQLEIPFLDLDDSGSVYPYQIMTIDIITKTL